MRLRICNFHLYFKLIQIFSLAIALLLVACGASSSSGGISANVLVLVTDGNGDPVSGATVWIPGEAAMRLQDFDGAGDPALVDAQGNACANPPGLALFAACTDAGGIAILPCGNEGVFLLNYFKGASSGVTNAKCGKEGVVPAPFN